MTSSNIITTSGELLGAINMANRVKVSDMPNSEHIEDAEILGKLIKAKRTKLNMKLADCAALFDFHAPPFDTMFEENCIGI